MDTFSGISLGVFAYIALAAFFIGILIVALQTWFITKIAIETYDRHRKKYGSQELDLMNTQIRQNENLLTAMIQIKNSTDQLNKTVEKLDNRIDNILLHKNTSHM